MRSRGRDGSPGRPTSSAETSIDEDTADRLLADDFSVSATPAPSKSGIIQFTRATASASPFDPQRRPSRDRSARSPSAGSSRSSPAIPVSKPKFAHRRSRTSPSEIVPLPPDVAPASEQIKPADLISEDHPNHEPNEELENRADQDPFSDPVYPPTVPPVLYPPLPILADEPGILSQDSFGEEKDRQSPFAADPETIPTYRRFGRKTIFLFALVTAVLVLLAILVPVGVLVIKPKDSKSDKSSNSNSGASGPGGATPASLGIPASAIGTVLDSTKWLDWTDFNVTYTNATVGGLSIMVLRSLIPYLTSRV
jgi:hypothetical protein